MLSLWDALKRVWEFLKGLGDTISGFFHNSGNWLVNAGENLISGFIQGIKNKIGALAQVLGTVASEITAHFPHSPAKKGPLSGRGSPYKSGQAFAAMMAAGMLDKTNIVRDASSQVAASMFPALASGYSPPTSLAPISLGGGGGVAGMTKNNAVTVNVYTNEIDPRTTATELGWELQGRL
jgi:hypothetical protein